MKNYKIILIALGYLFAICASCNPAKQVLKHQEQFEQVGAAWEKLHPCVNDSAVVVLPGRIDSVFLPAPVVNAEQKKTASDNLARELAIKYNQALNDCDRQVKEAFDVGFSMANDQWSKNKIAQKQPDTIKIAVKDGRREDQLQKEIDQLKTDKSNLKDKATKFKDQRNYAYLALGIIALIAIVIIIIKIKL